MSICAEVKVYWTKEQTNMKLSGLAKSLLKIKIFEEHTGGT